MGNEEPKPREGWEGIGFGHIELTKHGEARYHGTMPFKDGENVIMMTTKQVSDTMQDSLGILKQAFIDMPSSLYDVTKKSSTFPDQIVFKNARTNQEASVFLERNLYVFNGHNEIWVRYVSENRAFAEEMGGLEKLTDLDSNLRPQGSNEGPMPDSFIDENEEFYNDSPDNKPLDVVYPDDLLPPGYEPDFFDDDCGLPPWDNGGGLPPYDNGDDSDWRDNEPNGI